MRLRVPDTKHDEAVQGILDSLNAGAEDRKKEQWHKYEIEVITPIFGGGVEAGKPDTKMPIRASAIRGQLRYWWRFLAKAENPTWTEKDLFEEEREIWGGMAEAGEAHASKVKIRIKILSKNRPTLTPYTNEPPQYALFPARRQTDPPKPPKELIWPTSNITFELQLQTPEEQLQKTEQVLRWWITFGGIGARTRRGCGSVYSAKLDPISPAEANTAGCDLILQENNKKNALGAWKSVITSFQKFRRDSKWPE